MSTGWLSRANNPNYRNRGDYGVRVARPGYDASNCAENQLLFNSGWPIMQIKMVADFSSYTTSFEITKVTTVVYSIGTTGAMGAFIPESTEITNTEQIVQSVPEGLSGVDITEELDGFKAYAANKKYIRKLSGKTTLYEEAAVTESGDLSDGKKFLRVTNTSYHKREVKTASHNLGYVPLFFPCESLFGGDSDHVMLFTIDIATDVDYPYTEAPMPLVSAPHDYGIKSESIFGKNVPGLDSNMFSKLVQAVKTTKTSTFNDGTNNIVYWTPLPKDTDIDTTGEGCLTPYEFYAFTGDGNDDQEGGQFYTRFHPRYISRSSTTGAPKEESYMVGVMGQDTTPNGVLVVLRSPMVSPEYEEI